MIPFPPLPDGFRLLCLSTARIPPDQKKIADLLPHISDWPQVIAAARDHHVLPRLAQLTAQTTAAPVSARQELSTRLNRQAMLCLKLAGEVARLSHSLQAAGINALFFKGIALSQQLYGSIVARGPGDIDLLVPPEQFSAALSLLLTQGYQISDHRIAADSPFLHRVPVRDLELRHPSGTRVELHQRLTQDESLLPYPFETLWAHRQTVPGLPETVQTFGSLHTALYLLVHGAEHGWTRLRWLADLPPFFDDPRLAQDIWEEAGRLDLADALTEALILCHFFFGDPLPVPQTPAIQKRAIRHCRWLISGPHWQGNRPDGPVRVFTTYSLRLRWSQYTLRRTGRGAWQRFKADICEPVDWDLFRLPPGWEGFYPFLRPLGWAIRRMRRP